MLKIDWAQVKNLRAHLKRQGYTDESDVAIMILYRGNNESQRLKIKLKALEEILFEVGARPEVTGFYLFDAELKKPLWKLKEVDHSSSLESIPSSGHPSVILDFKSMTPDQRNVWVDMTTASIEQYVENEV